MKKFLSAVFLLVIIAAGAAWWGQQLLRTPYKSFAEPEIFVEIPGGTGVAAIASRLSDAGVVPHPLIFRAAVRPPAWTSACRRVSTALPMPLRQAKSRIASPGATSIPEL